jgi:hypothetical protein
VENELDQIGSIIDQATAAKDISVLDGAIVKCQELARLELSVGSRCLIHYLIANAWGGKRHALYTENDTSAWEQSELENEIFHLRKALSLSKEEKIQPIYVCQFLTNLGNALRAPRKISSFECFCRHEKAANQAA